MSAKTLFEIAIDKTLEGFHGTVVEYWSRRSIETDDTQEDRGVFEDDGPLAAQFSRVFNVILRCARRPPSTDKLINLFFYDDWADKCGFLTQGDHIVITGLSSIVLDDLSALDDQSKYNCCLAIREMPGLEVRSNLRVSLFNFN